MKNHISLLVLILSMTFCFSQEVTKAQTVTDGDDFTYEKIEILDFQEEDIVLASISNSKKSENQEDTSNRSSNSGIGETLGELSVSGTGAAVYNLPIEVPAGIKGVVPNISLIYNSQSGNGIAGYGWNISGVSSIGRIPSTNFHDGEIDEVDFDSLDRFALDGNRLILKSGSYGADGAVYETETYSNLKIKSYGVSSFGSEYGPSYFIVNYPDGSIGHYGANNNSSTRLKYALTYWEDTNGIRINYEYAHGNRLNKIKYGSQFSGASLNEIEFVYEVKFDFRKEESYIKDYVFGSIRRIKEVLVKSNDVLYKKYEISYNKTSLNYSRVANIKEYSGDGTLSHSPIYFNYTNSPGTVSVANYATNLAQTNIEQRNSEVTSLDITGNGRMDFFVTPKSNKDKFWLYKDIDPTTTNVPYQINTSGFYEEIFPVNWINSNNKYVGSEGLVVVQKANNNQVKFKVYGNGNTLDPINHQYTKTWDAPTYTYTNSPSSSTQKRITKKYISGDFNGDGLTDIIAIGKPYENKYCTTYECKNADDSSNPLQQQLDESDENFRLREIEHKETDYNKIPLEAPYDPNDPNDSLCYSCSTYTENFNGVYFIDLKQGVNLMGANTAGF